jgi:hypothetical protein
MCRDMFWRTWRLKPKAVYWIYTMVARVMVAYAATVWWPRIKFKTGRAKLSKLQRMACLGITGAIREVRTAGIEVLLGFPAPHLQLEAEATARIYRLYCSNQWKPQSEGSGYAYITQGERRT